MRTMHNPGVRPSALMPPGPTPAQIPFDYAATFPITGRPGTVHESVITFSPEGPFTATGVSYGFEQNRGVPIGAFLDPAGTAVVPGALRLSDIPIDVLLEGFRVGPKFLPVVFQTKLGANGLELTGGFSDSRLSPDVLNFTPILERVLPASPIEFFLSIVDSASGRELQDQPAFSVASLGESTGKRPFRYLPAPIRFGARGTVRIQIVERTENLEGTLFVNLFGSQTTGACAVSPPPPNGRAIPFDYVARLPLTGQAGNRVDQEVAISTEQSFIATSIGYGLDSADSVVPIAVPANATIVDLRAVQLQQFPPSALMDGIRIAPGFTRFAVAPSGVLNDQLSVRLADKIFESLNQPDSVSFRYALSDSGSGRDLQNQPIHNIAGLGSAAGERPFKQLSKPLRFGPRSTLRVTVEEHFGRGDLYLVLQGYQVLPGSGGIA